MRWMVKCVVFLVPFLLAMALLGQDLYEGREAASRQVLVKFRSGQEGRLGEVAAEMDIDNARQVGNDRVILMRSRSRDVTQLVRALAQRPYVQYAEPDYILRAIATPNDPYFSLLWGMRNTGQTILGVTGVIGADIGAASAWDVSTGSSSVVVGVVDTGVDYNHQDLKDNIWSAPAPFTVTVGGRTFTCPALSHGYNAIAGSCDPMDDNSHGTHVSGTIGAKGNNLTGVVGVNWTTSIMGLKFLDRNGSGSTSDAINAIEFAIEAKAHAGVNVRVLSNSWGGGGSSQALLAEINKAGANNMLFVAATGNAASNNDTTPFYPANYSATNLIAVAAADNRDQLASFSNYGATSVHLGAPGVSIVSTILGGGYAYYDGTSMATPHVSGAAALLLSKCGLTTADLRSNLLPTVVPITALAGKTTTGGRRNVFRAISACGAPTPDFTITATPTSRSVTQGAATSYTVNVSPVGSFSGAVSLSVTGLPAGAWNFSPNPATSSSSLTVTTSTIAAGSYPFTITGTSGSLSHSASATLVVTDFTISATPASRTVVQGTGTTYTANITRLAGFTGGVTFSVSGLPTGAGGTFSPNPATGTSSTLTVTTIATTPTGTYNLTITGTSGTLVHSTTVTLVVSATTAPSFTLTVSPGSRNVSRGSATSYTLTISASGGFGGVVGFSVTGQPAGSTVSFSPPAVTGSGLSTMSIVVPQGAKVGTCTLAVTASGGGVTKTATATLVVVRK